MKLPRCLSVSTVVFGLVFGLLVASCAGVKEKPGTGTGGTGNGSGTGKGGSTGSGGRGVIDAGFLETGNPANCGNGVLDPGEKCDDGNMVGGDGCTPICQIENGWVCPTVGAPCVRDAICGDGMLTPPEGCDDGNTTSGDGCSSTCMVETGFRCPVPGRPCVPICGDSITEQKMYSLIIESYLTACVPELKITARQYGWGGETAVLQWLKRSSAPALFKQ